MPLDPKRVEAVFAVALDLTDPAARADRLRRECGGDGELRQRVEALLAAYVEAGSFLDAPNAATPERRTGTEAPVPAIPGYEVLAVLGRGGMGVVYKARQTALHRLVALKMILAGGHAADEDQRRFLAEAEAVAALQHPNVVQLYEFGRHDGLPYLTLEFVPGGSLADKLQDPPLPPREAARLVEQTAQGIQAAHGRGIVHRDLKPANVLLTEDGTPKVTDFGLAKRVEVGSGLTATGAVIGTPSYMAPEQAGGQGKRVGPAADVYALGAILYECLTGRPPFKAATMLDTLLQVVGGEPVAVRQLQPGVPADLETICHKCLQKEPVRRYASAAELADDLRRFAADEPIRARRQSLAERLMRWGRRNPVVAALTAAVVVVTVTGFALVLWFLRAALVSKEDAVKSAGEATQRETEARTLAGKLDVEKKEVLRREADLRKTKRLLEIQLAQRDWDAGNAVQLREVLYRQLPGPGEEDLRGFEWFYLDGLLHSGLTLRGHTNEVTRVCFSPDGSRVATASQDGTVKVWDAGTGRETLTLTARGHPPQPDVCFSPDGARLVIGGVGVVVWDLRNGREALALERAAAPLAVYRLAYSPDGALLAGAVDGAVRVWDARTGKETLTLAGQKGMFCGLAFSADGTLLATTPADALKLPAVAASVFEVRGGKKVADLKVPGWTCRALAFSPPASKGPSLLAVALSGDNSSTVTVWDPGDVREPRLRFKDRALTPMSVTFSPDGDYLAAGFGPDRFQFAPGFVKRWRLHEGPDGPGLPVTYPGPRGWAGSIAFGPAAPGRSQPRLAAAFMDGIVRVWDAPPGSESVSLPGPQESLLAVGHTPDGVRLVCAANGKTVTVWKVIAGAPPVLLHTLAGHDRANGCVFSPDGLRLACTSEAGTVTVWDLAAGKSTCKLERRAQWPQAVAFSADGTVLASITSFGGGREATVQLWDSRDGKQLRTLDDSRLTSAVVFSPDGSRVAGVPGLAQPVKVWDARTGQRVFPDPGFGWLPPGTLAWMAYSPDGTRIASGGPLGPVVVWDAGTGREVLTFEGKVRSLGVSFSPDGKRLATTSADGMARIWDADTGQETLSSRVTGGTCQAPAFSPDGTSLAAVGSDGTLKVWSVGRDEPGRPDLALPLLDRRLAADPQDKAARRRRAALLTVRGDWERAAGDLAELARQSGDPALPWFDGGWWLCRCGELAADALPDAIPDPTRPEPVPAEKALTFQRLETDVNGSVEVGLHADVCAVSWVYAPSAREAALLLGPGINPRLWLNGEVVHPGGGEDLPATGARPVTRLSLRDGWNTLAVRPLRPGRLDFIRVRLSADPAHLAR
jgi:WD40 repeat protein/tRNA A-37 threonylcarbamoyl transferase component Bud32